MIRELGSYSARESASLKAKLAAVEAKIGSVAAAVTAAEAKGDRAAKESAAEVLAAREAARTEAARVGSGVDALRMHVISLKRRADDGEFVMCLKDTFDISLKKKADDGEFVMCWFTRFIINALLHSYFHDVMSNPEMLTWPDPQPCFALSLSINSESMRPDGQRMRRKQKYLN